MNIDSQGFFNNLDRFASFRTISHEQLQAAGNSPAALELVNRYKLNKPREQLAAVRKVMKPTDKPIGSNSFRYRRLIIRQVQKKAQ